MITIIFYSNNKTQNTYEIIGEVIYQKHIDVNVKNNKSNLTASSIL